MAHSNLKNNFLTTRDKGTCGQILYIFLMEQRQPVFQLCFPVKHAEKIDLTYMLFSFPWKDICTTLIVKWHLQIKILVFVLAQLQLVWVHVCLCAMCASCWSPAGLFSTRSTGLTVLSKVTQNTRRSFSAVSLQSHRPLWLTHSWPAEKKIVHIKSCCYLMESDTSGCVCRAVVCIHRTEVF